MPPAFVSTVRLCLSGGSAPRGDEIDAITGCRRAPRTCRLPSSREPRTPVAVTRSVAVPSEALVMLTLTVSSTTGSSPPAVALSRCARGREPAASGRGRDVHSERVARPERIRGSGRRPRIVQRERPLVGAGETGVLRRATGWRGRDRNAESVRRVARVAELRRGRPRSLLDDGDRAAPGRERQRGGRIEPGSDAGGRRHRRQRGAARRGEQIDRDRPAVRIGSVHADRSRAVGRGHVGGEGPRRDVGSERHAAESQ